MSSKAKSRPATSPVVFSGNGLRDGRVAWMGTEGRWEPRLGAVTPFAPEAAAEGLALAQQGERQQRVVGVYAVELGADGLPLKFRERLRLGGPSIDAEAA
ncbi:DUF2849 domain-containing protein [Paeniroseomonas aquatica]|uniref:DUF2849 domain-containing protein n=1 Tax=Paeniroseomonas aquatica TaxID=373043 RepID=UPI00338E230C